jgi:predicted O-methyltransferase YrrM
MMLDEPRRLTEFVAWQAHIPFAFACVQLTAPRRLVELGTAKGDSYCAFCQAVDTLGLETVCTAVDTWRGDPHSGELNDEILDDLRAHHDPLYSRFSQLLQLTFDEALHLFADGSIDFLHIDGYHTYDAVRHDFDAWLPKLSDRGVILLHDVTVRDRDFGVWRLWDEVSSRYQSCLLPHASGLGVLAVGAVQPPALTRLMKDVAAGGQTARVFSALGERLVARSRERELQTLLRECQMEARDLRAAGTGVREITDDLARTRELVAALERAVEDERLARLNAQQTVDALLTSRTFRYTARLRCFYSRLRARSPETLRRATHAARPAAEAGHPEFVPPGHFYSAIPALDELRARRQQLFDRDPLDIPGVDLRIDEQLGLLRQLAAHLPDVPFTDTPKEPLRYSFVNGMFEHVDGTFLYLLLRHLEPARIIEVGSGYSSACILDTVELHLADTRCTFVDPHMDRLRSLLRPTDDGIETLEIQAQEAPIGLFDSLRAGDLLFLDSTHVVKAGSDVNHFFFDIFPRLADGVIVHIHDVFPGFEYPWEWLIEGKVWSESYLLRAFLQYNSDFEILLWPSFLAAIRSEPIAPFLGSALHPGGSIYLRRRVGARRHEPSASSSTGR